MRQVVPAARNSGDTMPGPITPGASNDTSPGGVFADVGAAQPVPPHLADSYERARSAVEQATTDVLGSMETSIAPIQSALAAEQSAVGVAVGTAIGRVDSALRDSLATVARPIERVIDQTARALIMQEETLRAYGVQIPRGLDALRSALDDPSGGGIVNQLLPPEPPAPGERAVPVVDSSQPVPSLPIGAPAPVMSPGIGMPIGPIESAPIAARTSEAVPTMPAGGAVPVTDTTTAPERGIEPITLTGGSPPVPPPPPLSSPPAPPDLTTCGCSPPTITVTCPPASPPPPPSAPPPPPESPPAPPPPPPDYNVPFGYHGLDITAPICYQIEERVAQFARGPFYTGAPSSGSPLTGGLSQFYRAAQGYASGLITAITGGEPDTTRAALLSSYALAGDILGGHSQVITAMDMVPWGTEAHRVALTNLALTLGVFQRAEENTGAPVTLLAEPLAQMWRYETAYGIPSQAEINGLLVQSMCAREEWECITKCNGNRPDWQSRVAAAGHWRPNVNEATVLYLRGVYSESQYNDALAFVGAPGPSKRAEALALTTFVPGPSDIVRFMVRDAADDQVARTYSFDKDFETKLYGAGGKVAPGPMAAWMRANGITEDVMRMFWRSHWEIPSNTALYEALHRLRPDRPEVIQWDALAKDVEPELRERILDQRPLVVTSDDVQKAIEVNDMAPGWVRALMSISYHPINRSDAVDAYLLGVFDDDKLYHAMRDNGYDDGAAKQFVEIQAAKRAVRLANTSGMWTIRRVLKAYEDGVLSRLQADTLLAPMVLDASQRQTLLDGAEADVSAETARQAIKTARKMYLVGQWDRDAVAVKLANRGIDQRRTNDLIHRWELEREGRYKEPTVRLIIQWATLGIISAEDAYTRLRNIGYIDIDAQRIVYQGIVAYTTRVQGQLKTAQRELDKTVKSLGQAARMTESDLLKRWNQLKSDISFYQKESDRIEKALKQKGSGVGAPLPPPPPA